MEEFYFYTKGLTVGYHGVPLIKDIELSVKKGEILTLIGPNGAGKTTLMRIMTLLQNPSSGTIFFDDYDILRDRKAIRSVLGYLPQDFRFFEKLKTWEFLDYGAGLAGIKGTRKRSEIVDEMLRKVGLYEVRDRWANRLSGGMKRRLGIAQAIIGNPKVIIVDEPTTGLDPEERIRFRGIISDLSQQKLVLLSTHIVSDLEAVANEIILLRKGVVLEMQKPASLLEHLNGQVWLVTVPAADEAALTKQYTCSNVMHTDGKSVIRLLSESAPRPDAVPTAPNMEDLYLYYFGR